MDPSLLAPERTRPLYRREYDRLVELGSFQDERVELLHGALVELSPQGALHAEVVRRLSEAFLRALQGRGQVRTHSPLALTEDSEPEPDVAVVPPGDYSREHPAVAWLVVEVADSSLQKDRRLKAALYAAAGVPEYWIVNLVEGVVEVHRDPVGDHYDTIDRLAATGSVSPARFPDVALPIRDLLP